MRKRDLISAIKQDLLIDADPTDAGICEVCGGLAKYNAELIVCDTCKQTNT